MKQYLEFLFDRLKFPKEHNPALLAAYDVLKDYDEFSTLVDRFYIDKEITYSVIDEHLDNVIASAGINPHTAKFVFYCCLGKELPKQYAAAGIPEEIMWDSLEDLRYKIFECLDVKGVPGFFACDWFIWLFRLRLFKLGRLQFMIKAYEGEDIKLGDYTVKTGEKVIDIHIPSSGESFDTEARYDAYSRAYKFFRETKKEDVKAFVCSSWLLFPDHYDMLKPTSNIISFMNDFSIYKGELYEDKRSNLWRFFGSHAEKPFEELPRTNSLWRAYADRLSAGGDVGKGYGVFVWDDVNKVTIK